jgi:hypothetical protein
MNSECYYTDCQYHNCHSTDHSTDHSDGYFDGYFDEPICTLDKCAASDVELKRYDFFLRHMRRKIQNQEQERRRFLMGFSWIQNLPVQLSDRSKTGDSHDNSETSYLSVRGNSLA